MKIILFVILTCTSSISFAQCKPKFEELIKLSEMSNTQIETYTLETGFIRFEETYICEENQDILSVSNEESSSTIYYVTSDKTIYLEFKKHVESITNKNREETVNGITYFTYLYEQYNLGICEIMFNSKINEFGNWNGSIIMVMMH